MLFEDKKSVLSRALAGGIIGLVVFIPLGGLFNDLVNGGLITMGPHTPFRLVSYDLEALVGSASLALAIQIALYFLMGQWWGLLPFPLLTADGNWCFTLWSTSPSLPDCSSSPVPCWAGPGRGRPWWCTLSCWRWSIC